MPDKEIQTIIAFYHTKACSGHFSSKKIVAKTLHYGFYRSTMFREIHEFVNDENRARG